MIGAARRRGLHNRRDQMTAKLIDNPDHVSCDDCDNAPPKMVQVKTKKQYGDIGTLFLCRVCFKKLKHLEIT